MTAFRKLPDPDLDRLGDEQLFDHFRRARAYGEHEYAKHVLDVLAFGFQGRLTAFISIRAPADAALEIADDALESALKAKFDGTTIEEFRGLLYRIARRRRADYFRKGRIETGPLPEEHEGDEEIFGSTAAVRDETGLVEILELIAEAGAAINPVHRRVVELCLIEGHDSDTAAKEVNSEFPQNDPPMTRDNVDKIKSRFRQALLASLQTDPDG